MLRELFPVVGAGVLLILMAPMAIAQTQGTNTSIGPSSVFHFKDTYDAELNRCRDDDKACQDAATRRFEQSAIGQIKRCEDDNCASSVMRRFGASEEAIAFSRQFRFEGFMTRFTKAWKIGVVSVYFPGRVNDNSALFLVNGTPKIIDAAGCGTPDPEMLVTPMLGPDGREIDCLDSINITRQPLYKYLAKRVGDETGASPLMIWSGHAAFRKAQRIRSGGERLIVSFDLLRCHACKLAGHADIAYDFDSGGRLIGTKLLRLRRP